MILELLHSKDIPWLREWSIDIGVIENIGRDSLEELAGTNRGNSEAVNSHRKKERREAPGVGGMGGGLTRKTGSCHSRGASEPARSSLDVHKPEWALPID
jgi:hypothetical protein